MLKKMAIGILAMVVITLSGCSLFTNSTTEILPTPTPAPVVVEPLLDIYDAGIPADAPFDEVWLSPATYTVENYYAGYTIKCILRVHNGNSVATPFSVLYTQPDNVDAGFSAPTYDVPSWITISETYPIVEAYSTKEILITLAMPEGAIAPAHTWMFWVCAKDISQDTMIQTRLCTKVKITME